MEELLASLGIALEMERKGREFYFDAADRVEDRVVQSILVALARDEEAHESVISRYYQALERQKNWPAVEGDLDAMKSSHDQVSETIEATVSKIGKDATFLSVYEVARDLEHRSYDFYQARASEADDRDVREFFRFLAGVEQVHLTTLELLLDATRGEAEAARGE